MEKRECVQHRKGEGRERGGEGSVRHRKGERRGEGVRHRKGGEGGCVQSRGGVCMCGEKAGEGGCVHLERVEKDWEERGVLAQGKTWLSTSQ